jgi:hypothetical protein
MSRTSRELARKARAAEYKKSRLPETLLASVKATFRACPCGQRTCKGAWNVLEDMSLLDGAILIDPGDLEDMTDKTSIAFSHLAIPIGTGDSPNRRRGGQVLVDSTVDRVVKDAVEKLSSLPGFPDVRVYEDFIEWGEPFPEKDGVRIGDPFVIGRYFGYTDAAIHGFVNAIADGTHKCDCVTCAGARESVGGAA